MIERTRDSILRAFNQLIIRYDLSQITVDMIIKNSKVSKATFYRYFKDKYDVMNLNYKLLLDELSSPKISSSYLELYEHLFEYGQKKWKFLQRAFEMQGTNSMYEYIASYSKNLVFEITADNRNGGTLTSTEEFQLDIFLAGISTIYKTYIFDKYQLPPHEAAKALYDLMPLSLRTMWWTS
ncbi:MAG: TetR/AcrR family transcriptional regulator C-terminal domain-containing protein [Pseudobutyrivibrio sp.]|nr:TetR/AcrR family transcriptional regulator C-terminal domain-containing protein [Pseudobutyrivibrio sp.]